MASVTIKSVLKNAVEVIVAIALVLAFYLLINKMLHTFFPIGSNFNEMLERQNLLGIGHAPSAARALSISAGGRDALLSDESTVVALLAKTRNTVKSKRADTIAWLTAEPGMGLHNRDAIQTFKKAEAVIEFDKNNYLQIGQNSLVVIRTMESDPIFRARRSFTMAVDGELSGKITSSTSEAVSLTVTTPNTVAKIGSKILAEGGAEFKIKVNPDKTSTIAVYSGSAELSSKQGTIRVQSNQAASIDPDGGAGAVVPLPSPPTPTTPATGSVYYYRDVPRRIQFNWEAVPEVDQFHLVIARDSTFTDIIVDEQLSRTGFAHGNLKQGDYYWKVSSLRSGGEGAFSQSGTLSVVQDVLPPRLEVELPPAVAATPHFVISGITERDAVLYITGKPVAVADDGTFAYELALERGSNVIIVEAIDAAGNVSYKSQVVSGQFQ